jgi:hypothetical protein
VPFLPSSHMRLSNGLPFSSKPAAASASRFYTMSLRRGCQSSAGWTALGPAERHYLEHDVKNSSRIDRLAG